MLKTITLSIAACLAFTGCQVFQKSPTWGKVVRTHFALPRGSDTSRAYSGELHRELNAHHIENKVVTYQYRYTTRLRDYATAERTAVLYRDTTHSKYQWWLKDDTSNRPRWLPNGSLAQQVRFYMGREVEIVDPGHASGGDGKEVVHKQGHAKKKAKAHKKPAHRKAKK